MENKKIICNINRLNKNFYPDIKRVIIKPLIPKDEGRIKRLITRVLDLPDEAAENLLDSIIKNFSHRHKNIFKAFNENFNAVEKYIPLNAEINNNKQLLIGAYFSSEYSVQAAAFFNPSIVVHPNQCGLEEGSLRFILSFRSVGEGHISSIEFRSGIVDGNCNFIFDKVSPYAESGQIINASIKENIIQNYEIQFSLDNDLSERVIFPQSQHDCNGIEDARFVRFTDDNKDVTYYATYTAYNGHDILPQILETKDFIKFKMHALTGRFAENKGMALFPRKVNGKYMMISRIDGENLYCMSSDNLYHWENAQLLKKPESTWEFIQIGNCGSPIETDYGWILLTHGVGPMRQYCIGITLLDIADPNKIIDNIVEPLIIPAEDEREGYVPNVVYSCGAIAHNDNLIIPYAMSDTYSGIITLSVSELFNSREKKRDYAKST